MGDPPSFLTPVLDDPGGNFRRRPVQLPPGNFTTPGRNLTSCSLHPGPSWTWATLKTYGPEGWDEQQATLPTHGYAFHQCSPVTSAVAVVPGWLLEVAGGPGSSSSPTQLPKCRLSSQPHHPRKRRRIGAATPSSHQPIRHLDRGGNTSLSHKNLMCMRRFTVASPPCRMQEYSCMRWFTVAFFLRPHPVSP